MTGQRPSNGEVWLVNLNPTRGHEQAGIRPALVVSADRFNRSPAGLAIVVPLTTTRQGVPWHVPIVPPDGGVRIISFAKCEDIRSLSVGRFIERWGAVATPVGQEVGDKLRVLLNL